MPIFSREDLERIKHETQEPARRSGNSIVSRVLPLTPAAARKPAVYNLDDPNPIVEPEAAKPVAAPVPVKKKKIIVIDMNTGVRKIEYR